MAKKKKKKGDEGYDFSVSSEVAYKELQNYKRKDLQKVCITMGIPFDRVSDSQTQLMSWFTQNYGRTRNHNLLLEYDDWFEEEMAKRHDKEDPKFSYLFHPAMRMSAKEEEPNEVLKIKKKIKEKKLKVEKPARAKDEDTGIVSGTKKAYTYHLVKKGLSEKKVLKRVLNKFPEAKEISIKIWIKRALKL